LIQDFPSSRTRGAIEELDPREQGVLGPRREFQVDDLVQEVGTDVIFGDLYRRFLMKVGEFSDRTDVALDGSIGHSGQSQFFDHFVVPLSFEMLRNPG
jgi:hypothetical protein